MRSFEGIFVLTDATMAERCNVNIVAGAIELGAYCRRANDLREKAKAAMFDERVVGTTIKQVRTTTNGKQLVVSNGMRVQSV